MDMNDIIDIDVEEIRGILSNSPLEELNDNYNNYDQQWLTLDSISKVFNVIDNIGKKYRDVIDNYKIHFDELDEIASSSLVIDNGKIMVTQEVIVNNNESNDMVKNNNISSITLGEKTFTVENSDKSQKNDEKLQSISQVTIKHETDDNGNEVDWTFDESGLLLSEHRVSKDGRVEDYVYNANGKKISGIEVYNNGNTIAKHLYDENGYLLSTMYSFKDDSGLKSESITYKRDESGKIIERKQLRILKDGIVSVGVYDNNMNVKELFTKEVYLDGGELQRNLNSNGTVYHEHYVNADNSIHDLMYDENGTLYKQVKYDSTGKVSWASQKFDNGQLLEREYNPNGTVKYDHYVNADNSIHNLTYDENGNKILEEKFDSNGYKIL